MKGLEVLNHNIDFFGRCSLNKQEVEIIRNDLKTLELLKQKIYDNKASELIVVKNKDKELVIKLEGNK